MRHEAVVAFEVGEDGAGFGPGKDDGELRRALDAFDAGNVFELLLKHFPVKEKESAEGLILGGGGDAAVDGEVAEEGGDFFFAHRLGVPLPVEEDVSANPIEVNLLGADAVAFDAEVPADAIEEPERRRGSGDRSGEVDGGGQHAREAICSARGRARRESGRTGGGKSRR